MFNFFLYYPEDKKIVASDETEHYPLIDSEHGVEMVLHYAVFLWITHTTGARGTDCYTV